MGRGFIDLTGKRFGRWTVIRRSYPNKYNHSRWLCKCECGKERIVIGYSLSSGNTKSCGCLQKERTSESRRLPSGVASMRNTMSNYKVGAEKRGLEWSLSEEQFKEITQKDCHYCGAKPNNNSKGSHGNNGNYVYNGLDRIDNFKGYTKDNIVPCCKTCNFAKGDLTLQEFKDWIRKVYKKLG